MSIGRKVGNNDLRAGGARSTWQWLYKAGESFQGEKGEQEAEAGRERRESAPGGGEK